MIRYANHFSSAPFDGTRNARCAWRVAPEPTFIPEMVSHLRFEEVQIPNSGNFINIEHANLQVATFARGHVFEESKLLDEMLLKR